MKALVNFALVTLLAILAPCSPVNGAGWPLSSEQWDHLVQETKVQQQARKVSKQTKASGKEYKTVTVNNISVPATGGAVLSMDCALAISMKYGERFPVLVFPNSWGMPQIEYDLRIHDLAKKGYCACEYETRGWWRSGGTIDTAGKLDREDTTTIIKYIQSQVDNWQVNTTNFAFIGISYGAGLSLMSAGENADVVTTAVAMSGWGKLNEGFYYNDSPNNASLHSLLKTAEAVGHPAASLPDFYQWIINHENMGQVWDFIHSRSPELLFLDSYNQNKKPIFLSNNVGDHFFFPQAKANFFNKLTGPKFQLINQGGHAIPEGVGLFLMENYIWDKVYQWLDYWTKGIDNGIMQEPNVQLQNSKDIWGTNYTKLSHWGDVSKIESKRSYLSPPGWFPTEIGGLVSSPPSASTESMKWFKNKTLGFGWGLWHDGQEFAGLPDPVIFGDVFKKGVNLIYATPKFTENTTICGTPNISLSLTVPSTRRWQLYGVQYEYNENGIFPFGNILGDFMLTYWGTYDTVNNTAIRIPESDVKPGPTAGTETVTIRGINARTICHTFAKPRGYAVGFVLNSDNFAASAQEGLEVGINLGPDSYVDLPFQKP